MAISAIPASEQRVRDRQLDIQCAACQLVVEYGYDGFTMDQLAEAVGISRRTLFNTVRDKESAVLGPKNDLDCHPAIEAFRQSAPAAEPFREVVDFVRGIMDDMVDDHPRALESHLLAEQAIAADAKMQQLVSNRYSEITELASHLISTRQNWSDGDLRARVMASTLLALVQLSIEEFTHEGRSIGEVFQDVVDAFWDSTAPN